MKATPERAYNAVAALTRAYLGFTTIAITELMGRQPAHDEERQQYYVVSLRLRKPNGEVEAEAILFYPEKPSYVVNVEDGEIKAEKL